MKGPFNGSIYFDGDADSYYKYENMFLEYLESLGQYSMNLRLWKRNL